MRYYAFEMNYYKEPEQMNPFFIENILQSPNDSVNFL